MSIRLAGWAGVAVLWIAQLIEAVKDPQMLPVPVDHWVDRATIVVTLSLAVHEIARRYGRPAIVSDIDRRLAAQERGLIAAFDYAGVAPNKRHLQAVGDEQQQG